MLKISKVIILLLSFFPVCYGFESLPPTKWVKPLKEINMVPIHLTEYSSGYFIMVDSTKIVVVDSHLGQVIRTVSGFSQINSIEKVADGGFIISDLDKIVLLNDSLEVVWSKSIIGGQTVTMKSANQTSDSGFIALAEIWRSIVKIIKTDRNGDTLWSRSKGDSLNMEAYYGTGVVEAGGKYIACGDYCLGACLGMPGWISAYSPDGNEIWSKSKPAFTIHNIQVLNDGVVMTGSTENGSQPFTDIINNSEAMRKIKWFPATDLFLVQLGADGKVELDTSYTFNKYSYGKSIAKVKNTYLVSGFTGTYDFSTGEKEQIVFNTDLEGKSLWTKKYNVKREIPALVKVLSSGELIVAAGDSIYFYENVSVSGFPDKRPMKPEVDIVQTGMMGKITYTLGNSSFVTINLLNLNGRKVKILEKRFVHAGMHSLSIENCSPGNYLIEIINENTRKRVSKMITSVTEF